MGVWNLGDSFLSVIVAEVLYLRDSENKLSKLKAQIVSASNLSVWAQKINLGDYIF
jgi:dsRNA-specific ribonuclease